MNHTHEHIALAVRAEHRQLHQKLHEMERLLKIEEPSAGCVKQVLHDLVALREQLAQHFDREETGGFLDEAVAQAPRFSDEATRLMHHHSAFLAELDGMIQLAHEAVAAIAARSELREKALDLFHALRLHEADEDRILQQVFPAEVEEEDEEEKEECE